MRPLLLLNWLQSARVGIDYFPSATGTVARSGDLSGAVHQKCPLLCPATPAPWPAAAASASLWLQPPSAGPSTSAGRASKWPACRQAVVVCSVGQDTGGRDWGGGNGGSGGRGSSGGQGGWGGDEGPEPSNPFNGRDGVPIFLLCVASGVVIAAAITITGPAVALHAALKHSSSEGASSVSPAGRAVAAAGDQGALLSKLHSLLSKGPSSPDGGSSSGKSNSGGGSSSGNSSSGSSSSGGGGASRSSSSSKSSSGTHSSSEEPLPSVSVIVPVLNEAKGIRDTLRHLKCMDPPPSEIIVADGGSTDSTVWRAALEGAHVVRSKGRGRGRQMNSGAESAKGDILVFVHADSRPPLNLVPIVRGVLQNPRVVLGGFNTIIELPERVLLWMTGFNFAKTYLAPILFRPLSFARGLRLLFGDQSMFCRAADFRRVGGFDGRLPIMEDADLCVRMHMAGPGGGLPGRGHIRLVLHPFNHTSGRRLGRMGNLRGSYAAARISLEWYLGAPPERIWELYRQLWSDRVR